MPEHDVQWSRYPAVVNEPTARAWLRMQADRNLAKHTVETYGRSMEDFLRFTGREGIQPAQATREHLAAYARDLLARANPRQPSVVSLDSGAGLANATIQLRLAVIRLFFDYLVEEGLRSTNPAGGCCGADVMAARLARRRSSVVTGASPGSQRRSSGRRSWA